MAGPKNKLKSGKLSYGKQNIQYIGQDRRQILHSEKLKIKLKMQRYQETLLDRWIYEYYNLQSPRRIFQRKIENRDEWEDYHNLRALIN